MRNEATVHTRSVYGERCRKASASLCSFDEQKCFVLRAWGDFGGAALQPLADRPLTAKRDSVGMHASVPRQPNFSDTPILQPATSTGRCRGSERAPVPQKEHGFPAARQHYQLESRIQQLLAPQAALPIAAGLLLLFNHYDAVWSLIRHVGVIDCIALSCLALSVILAAPHLMMMLRAEASNAPRTSLVRLPEMADNMATLSSAVRLVQQDPAPRHWLDMYYNLCSDVDNLLQEMSKVRKLMAELNTNADHVKDKTAWMRKANKK